MSFAASARVEVDLDDGRTIVRDIDLPRGFSGDDRRGDVAREKLTREGPLVMRAEEAVALREVLASPFPAGGELAACVAPPRTETTDYAGVPAS